MGIRIIVIPSAREEEPRELTFPKNEVRVGRGLYNDVVLDSLEVATNHAVISVNDSDGRPTLTLTDLGSSTGTRLEGAPIPSRYAIQMSPAQRIEIGGFILKVEALGRQREQRDGQAQSRDLRMRELREAAHESRTNIDAHASEKKPGSIASLAASSSQKLTPADTPYIARPRPSVPTGKEQRHPAISHQVEHPDSWRSRFVATDSEMPGRTVPKSEPVEPQEEVVEPFEESVPEVVEETSSELGKFDNEAKFSDADEQVEAALPEKQYHEEVENSHLGERTVTPEVFQKEKKGMESTLTSYSSNDVIEIADIEVERELTHSIIGTVIGGSSPVEGVHVQLTINGVEKAVTSTSEQGVFSFTDVPQGSDYSISLQKSAWIFFPDVLRGRIDQNLFLAVGALQTQDLRGRVSRLGVPVSGIKIDAGSLGLVNTSESGEFVFSDLPVGMNLQLKFLSENYLLEPNILEAVVQEDNVELEIRAIKLVTVTGRLLSKGLPVAGIEIDGEDLGKTVTGPDGRYSFFHVREDVNLTLQATPNPRVYRVRKEPKH